MGDQQYNEAEIQAMTWGEHPDWETVDRTEEEPRRWTRTVTTVIKHRETGALMAIDWEEGLTECQENMYDGQPYPVEAYEEVIPAKAVTRYRRAQG